MKTRRIISIAAAICLLCVCAAADGYGTYFNPVDISKSGAVPTGWDVQDATDTFCVDELFDGKRITKLTHLCWAKKATDDIPDITLYFSRGATVKDIWLRNGWESSSVSYYEYARLQVFSVTLWSGDNDLGTYKFYPKDYVDQDVYTRELYDGYQRMALPKKFENVTRIDLWIMGWYPGEALNSKNNKYYMRVSDMIFLPDTLEELYGKRIFQDSYESRVTPARVTPTPTPDPYASWPTRDPYETWPTQDPYEAWPTQDPYEQWTPARTTPTPMPVTTPRPAATETPFAGLQVRSYGSLSACSAPGGADELVYSRSATRVKALSCVYDEASAAWWAQVEVTYNGELRRVYTPADQLDFLPDQVPAENAEGGAVLIRSVYGYWGPGYGYSMFRDKIPAGISGTIWQREGAYAQFEYYDERTQQYRRVWVPEKALETVNG